MLVRAAFVVTLAGGCVEEPGTSGTPGSTAAGCEADRPGALTVDIPEVALDEPVTVVVLDPSGAEVARLTETTTLEDLPGGTYALVMERGLVYRPEQRVDEAHGGYTETATRVCVGGDEAVVHLAIALQHSSGELWVSSWEDLYAFRVEDLVPGALATPTTRLHVRLTNNFESLRFDRSGNLWATTPWTYGARLLMFRPDQLGGDREVEAHLELSAPGMTDTYAAISDVWFTEQGDAWVLIGRDDQGFSGFLGWSRAALLDAVIDGGKVDLAPTWSYAHPELLSASDAVVYGEDVFVAVQDSDRVLRYALDDLGGAPRAEIAFQDTGGLDLRGPTEITAAGDTLWVSLWTSGVFAPFSPTADGAVVVDPSGIAVTDLPTGLDADATGTVWWGNEDFGAGATVEGLDASGASLGAVELEMGVVHEIRFDPSYGG